jgi:hypothetical protein
MHTCCWHETRPVLADWHLPPLPSPHYAKAPHLPLKGPASMKLLLCDEAAGQRLMYAPLNFFSALFCSAHLLTHCVSCKLAAVKPTCPLGLLPPPAQHSLMVNHEEKTPRPGQKKINCPHAGMHGDLPPANWQEPHAPLTHLTNRHSLFCPASFIL